MSDSNDDKITFYINKQTIETRKYFVYGEQLYEIDFDKIKKNCRYFYQNRKQYKDTVYINLLDDDETFIELTDETIKGFISICQNEKCELSHSTINSLHYLASKYDFPELQNITKEYLNKHTNELCLDTLLFKINMNESKRKNNDTEYEEKYISHHLHNFITKNEEKMTKLPIQVLHRILNNYYSTQEEKELNIVK